MIRKPLRRGTAPRPSRWLKQRSAKTPTIPGRSLTDFIPLVSTAEQALLRAACLGEVAALGTTAPSTPSDANRVRARFLRFLLLGGDVQAPLHEGGVRLCGAYVEGALDLAGCRLPGNLDLKHCTLTQAILVQDARVSGLVALDGCNVPDGLSADRMQCEGGLYLRNGFRAGATVRLLGTQIGGQLDCGGGQFEAKSGQALSADRAVIKGSVFLSEGFKAQAEVRLLGAQIDGNLTCINGQFEAMDGDALSVDGAVIRGDVFLSNGFRACADVRLPGTQIGGDLDCSGGRFEPTSSSALWLDRAVIHGGVFMNGGFKADATVRLLGAHINGDFTCRGGHFAAPSIGLHAQGAEIRGAWLFDQMVAPVRVIAASMQVGVLVDDIKAWAEGSVLAGFRYGAFGGRAPTTARQRLDWLHKQTPSDLGGQGSNANSFRPQPWHQLQRALREMGHAEDARLIGIAYEEHLRRIGHIGESPEGTSRWLATPKRCTAESLHWLFGVLAGYGYRPLRLLAWLLGVWLVSAALFWRLALPPFNALAPSEPLVFQNPAYSACQPDQTRPPANWYLCGPLRGEYATFSPLAFSADILLPVVDLGQEKTWGAFVPTPRESWTSELFTHWHPGHLVRLWGWFETLFGWICSLLLVAILSGFARRSEE